jgi:hypothetical protein
MSRFSSFLFGFVTGAALFYVAMNYHLIRSGEGFHFVGKQPPRLSEAFLDVRSFTVGDWAGHPQVAAALVQADKQHLISNSAAGALQQELHEMLPTFPKQ